MLTHKRITKTLNLINKKHRPIDKLTKSHGQTGTLQGDYLFHYLIWKNKCLERVTSHCFLTCGCETLYRVLLKWSWETVGCTQGGGVMQEVHKGCHVHTQQLHPWEKLLYLVEGMQVWWNYIAGNYRAGGKFNFARSRFFSAGIRTIQEDIMYAWYWDWAIECIFLCFILI